MELVGFSGVSCAWTSRPCTPSRVEAQSPFYTAMRDLDCRWFHPSECNLAVLGISLDALLEPLPLGSRLFSWTRAIHEPSMHGRDSRGCQCIKDRPTELSLFLSPSLPPKCGDIDVDAKPSEFFQKQL